MRPMLMLLCALGLLACTRKQPEPPPPAEAAPKPESSPAQEAPSPPPPKRMVGAFEAYRPEKSLCAKLPPVEGTWREHPDADLTLVPQKEQSVYRIVGRTNLPDDIVVFAGVSGFGGWSDAHLVVEEECFVSPPFHIAPGMYILDVSISDLEGLDESIAEEIGEYGWKLKANIVNEGGDKEFRVEKLVGIGADPEASYKSHLKLREAFMKDVRELVVVGERLSKFRKRLARGDWETLGKCTAGIERRNDDVEVMIDKYSEHDSVFNRATLGLMRTHLWDCVECTDNGDKGCREAKKELQRGAWKLDDVVAEFKERHGVK